jgi:TATA-box binding protein (TBP) (component of TFIID and TFIIIB)
MTNKSKWDSFNCIDYINVSDIEIKNLPSGINVSTMSASCKLNTNIDITNIENYLLLNTNDIMTVKMSNDKIRTLETIKSKTKRKKKIELKPKNDTSKNHFYNQITVIIRVTNGNYKDLSDEPKINMKLFKNGSIQMSGCKTIKNINIALNKLIVRLSEIKGKIENNKIVEKKFIENLENITVKDFKINMINSNYQVNINIDRDKLYSLLNKKKIKCSYEPCIRACVIIKYTPIEDNIDQKIVSVFIFQKGNIIITGSRSRSHILSTYNYINEILLTHIDEITKKNEEDSSDILDIYSNIMNEINIGVIKLKKEDNDYLSLKENKHTKKISHV